MKNDTKVKLLETRNSYSGFFKINSYTLKFKKFDGTMSLPIVREIFERGSAVGVLPYDSKTNKVLLIRQFLPGAYVAGWPNCPLQIIAGMIEKDHTPEETAICESVEEAGLAVSKLEKISAYLPSPGGSSEYIHLFLAETDLDENNKGVFGLEEEGEDIKVEILDVQEAIHLLDTGEIESSLAVISLLQLARKLKL